MDFASGKRVFVQVLAQNLFSNRMRNQSHYPTKGLAARFVVFCCCSMANNIAPIRCLNLQSSARFLRSFPDSSCLARSGGGMETDASLAERTFDPGNAPVLGEPL